MAAASLNGTTPRSASRALGMIRTDYSDTVRRALGGKVGKDLVKLPVYEIEKQALLSGAAK
ncbi:protein required for attachment to host cells [Bradyrhizobium sp. S3.12.5]